MSEKPTDRLSDGPWERLPRGAFNMLTVSDKYGSPVAHVVEKSREKANARAIGAVWDMVEVLLLVERAMPRLTEMENYVLVTGRWPSYGEGEPFGPKLRAVLAKVRGEAPPEKRDDA